jgi:DNA-binding LacI/PurR family transcriptional regulator
MLATVHVPHREMGKTAAWALVDFLVNDKPIEPVELKTELRLRASLGRVPY